MTYQVFESCVLLPGFSRTECASWVQAIGSVLAICVAIYIAWHQAKQARLAWALPSGHRVVPRPAAPRRGWNGSTPLHGYYLVAMA